MLRRLLRRATLILAIAAFTLLAVRVYEAQRGPDLESWHTFHPHELTADQIAETDWAGYQKAEDALFEEVRTQVSGKLAPDERVPANRYFEGSPASPGRFPQDWNRSFVLTPGAGPAGAVVLLHGLTDSPYSMRHVARRYAERGWVAVAVRLPGHGTVPGSLTDISWEHWVEATRLAVREAQRLAPSAPLHLVGYSTGGALAMKHALDALDDPSLAKPDRIVLISPMIGITAFARFAGLLGLPAVLPAFAKAAWLSVVPEFNPFKYNSFPVNAARQSSLLARALQQALSRHGRDNRLVELPPILTFQSVVDFTVSTRAIVSSLYAQLPANGSELVLFDLNRNAKLDLLLRSSADTVLDGLLPDVPRRFEATIVTNAAPDSSDVVARTTPAGAVTEQSRALGLSYPADMFSLSHVAVPFPTSDGLYGTHPDPAERFGVNLGAMAARGERGILLVSLDFLSRTPSNPFFPFLLDRIEAGIVPVPGRVPDLE